LEAATSRLQNFWENFKRDFTLSHREFRENKTTTAGARYQSANAAHGLGNGEAIYQQDTVNAIANLATATAHDRNTVATLTSTNSALSSELTTVNRKFVFALTEIARLNGLISNSPTGATSWPGDSFEAKQYCWSCGYRCTHYSSRCPVPKPGHQKSAKAADILGGSTANKHPWHGLETNAIINNVFNPTLVPTPATGAIADIGCTSHFLSPQAPYEQLVPVADGLRVGLPNGATLQSTHRALLHIAGPLPQLPIRARQANVFPGITGKALVSIGQLCDNGY
jgi:hypothetical protein